MDARELGSDALDASLRPRKTREIAPGVHFLAGFGNTTFILGTDGVAVVDPGLFTSGPRVVRELRAITDLPVRYVIYTHGHYDHAFGTPALLDDAEARGHDAPDIVGHVNVAKRFERYAKTAGSPRPHLRRAVRELGTRAVATSSARRGTARRRSPTRTGSLLDGLGDRPIELRHGLGETDDHTWVWIPDAKVIVGGDFIVSSLPNAGTPFRVQRYVLEWAEALEAMAAVEPAAIVSGHGDVFTDDAAEMLLTTSRALRWLDAEVVRRINDGQWQEQIIDEVELPADLAASEYLQPLYGCTSFAVRDLLRRYMGWYDGNPSMVFPSTRADDRPRGRGAHRRHRSRSCARADELAARRRRRPTAGAAPRRLRDLRRWRRRRRGPRAQGRPARRAGRGRAVVRGQQRPAGRPRPWSAPRRRDRTRRDLACVPGLGSPATHGATRGARDGTAGGRRRRRSDRDAFTQDRVGAVAAAARVIT